MASNKKTKKAAQPVRLSPERWMREKARTMPLNTTYMNYLPEEGTASVLVSRTRPSGNVAYALFLVDTFCLGVKDILWGANVEASEWPERRDSIISGLDLKEVPYADAHNLIYGAVEWAGEADIMPGKGWDTAKYVLEDDTDDVPYVEYEFGDHGLYHLIVEARPEEKRLIPMLEKRLGDRFIYTIEDEDNSGDEETESWYDDDKRLPDEPYSYPDRPAYPEVCEVKNPWLLDALTDPANMFGLPVEISDRIMALPPDEAAADIAAVIEWETGRTYAAIDRGDEDFDDNGSLLLGLMYLSIIDSRVALPAVIDVARQSYGFSETHLGDYAEELITQALYTSAGDDISPLVKLLTVPGLSYYGRFAVAAAIAMTALHRPGRRDEVIGVFRDELHRLQADLPELRAADGKYAGFLMSLLDDLAARELLPEIKAVFDTGCVNRSIAGDYDEVAERLENNPEPSSFLSLRTLDDYRTSLDNSRRISESADR